MDNEHHIYGPPGAGKTTTLIKNVTNAVKVHSGNKVIVCSFTKAAATEMVQRNVPVMPENIGTLHALCYRALGTPDIAEACIDEWNEANPGLRIAGETNDIDDEGVSDTSSGDGILQNYNLLRSRLTPVELWPERIRNFATRWEDWKSATDVIDYGDMIDLGSKNFDICPGNPSIMFVDEAQDFNAAQFQCVRHWARHMERVVFVGDDDQAIYRFTGADARHMIDRDIPDKNRIILNKSWRLGKAVHKAAETWIKKCDHRMEKDFVAQHDEGEVKHLTAGSYKNPGPIIDKMLEKIEAGETCMLLASCSYMLTEAVAALRSNGILFHNPYKAKRGDWNPVKLSEGSTIQRITQFLRVDEGGVVPMWSPFNLFQWSGLVKKTGVFQRGTVKLLEELSKKDTCHKVMSSSELSMFLEEGPWFDIDPWDKSMLDWLEAHAAKGKAEAIKFIASAMRRSTKPIDPMAAPKLIIGTIHSVKGAEADNVFLFPDISRAGAMEWDRGGDDRDAQRRVFYVGMTRARKNLYVAPAASGLSVKLF